MAIVLRSNKAIKVSPQLARVQEFKERVLEDGGEIINEAAILSGYSFLERVGLRDNNLVSFASPEFAVKKDEVGKIHTVYSLVGGSGADLLNNQARASLTTVNGKTRLSFADGLAGQTYGLSTGITLAPEGGLHSAFYGANYTQENKTANVTLGALTLAGWIMSSFNSTTTSVEHTGFSYKEIANTSNTPYNLNDESGTPLSSYLFVAGASDGYLYKNGELIKEGKPSGAVIMNTPSKILLYTLGGVGRSAVPSGYLGLTAVGYNINPEQQLMLAKYIENYG